MNTKYIYGLAVASMLMTSCSEDIMDRINKDEAHPGIALVDAKFQITDAITATSFSVINGDYAWYVSSYTEQEFGTGNNQMKQAEIRDYAAVAGSSVFNNVWNSTYSNLNNLKIIRDKCQNGGINAGQYDLLGMAQTLEALNLGVLTDLHGDVPYSECFGNINAPKIDSQESLYTRIFALLDSAQVNFAKGGKNVGAQDILFANDLTQWSAFAHALKARYLLHTYGVNKSVLSQVLTEANAAVTAGFKGCNFSVFDGKNADNSWSAYHWSRYNVASSTTVLNLMTDRNDPRAELYSAQGFESGNGQTGVPGTLEQAVLTQQLNYPAWLENGAAYQHLFSVSELQFIIAEVKARLGQNAQTEFEAGVKAAMADYGTASGETISDANIATYLTSVQARYAADPLKEIFVQKYIAQARDEQIETYNDIRRCRFVDGSYAVTMTNPKNTQSNLNRWPLRLPYGESDVTSNPNVTAAFGSGNEAGAYVFTAPIWWAGGSR